MREWWAYDKELYMAECQVEDRHHTRLVEYSDAENAIAEARADERDKIARSLQMMLSSVPEMEYGKKVGVKAALEYIKSLSNPSEPKKLEHICESELDRNVYLAVEKLNSVIDAVNELRGAK